MILVHGRNAGPENILELIGPLSHPEFTYLAPAAPGGTWYPQSFLAETERNEPALSRALDRLHQVVGEVTRHIPRQRLILLPSTAGVPRLQRR